MKKPWIAVVVTLLASALSAVAARPGAAGIRRLDGSKISVSEAEAFAKKTLEANHVTGAEMAVINKGKLVWSAAFGLRRRDPALPMDRETTTWAASITKSVFATYVMQLVERGEFDWTSPLHSNFPSRSIHTSLTKRRRRTLFMIPHGRP